MDERFISIRNGRELSKDSLRNLQDLGFAIVPGPYESRHLERIAAAYDSAVRNAGPDNKRIGSSTTRVNDLINREKDFEPLYIHQPVLEASGHIIGKPFKLSSMHARTLHPYSRAQRLHVDFKPNEDPFPLAGFIFMVDEFRHDNGATRFIPGSHKWSVSPAGLADDAFANFESQTELACGKAGSVIIFNGSVWHGYSANLTNTLRRSIQGAFIPRNEKSALDFGSCLRPETLVRTSKLGKYLLGI